MTQTFEYRGFKITVQPAVLAIETMRVIAKKGRKTFSGKLGDVTREIDEWMTK